MPVVFAPAPPTRRKQPGQRDAAPQQRLRAAQVPLATPLGCLAATPCLSSFTAR